MPTCSCGALLTDALMGSGFALIVFDAQGEERVRNTAYADRVAQHPGTGLEERVASAVAHALSAGPDGLREAAAITVDDVRYLIRFVPLPAGLMAEEPLVAAGLVRLSGLPLTVANLVGRYGLTRREAEVARLLARGYSNKAVAAELRVSPYTARNHARAVMVRLGVASRAKAAALVNRDFGPGAG